MSYIHRHWLLVLYKKGTFLQIDKSAFRVGFKFQFLSMGVWPPRGYTSISLITEFMTSKHVTNWILLSICSGCVRLPLGLWHQFCISLYMLLILHCPTISSKLYLDWFQFNKIIKSKSGNICWMFIHGNILLRPCRLSGWPLCLIINTCSWEFVFEL